ncbi:MAG: dethiobiotin synthase [Verrucomicrobiota bacterium]
MTLFITGTDTGVGKTVLTCLLTRQLRADKISVAALKPLCSGDRADALEMHAALEKTLTLDEINPWHFRLPLSPLIAARREKRKVTLAQVIDFARPFQQRFSVTLIEGAGGLLSPLGEDFDSRDLLLKLRATPIVVCPNRLGAINQVRLVLEALPQRSSSRAQIVLMSPATPDVSTKTNGQLLGEIFGPQRVHLVPWLPENLTAQMNPAIRRTLRLLIANCSR